MTVRMTVAVAAYSAVGVVGMAMALRHVAARQFMSYHATASGCQWESLSPGVQLVLLTLLKAAARGSSRAPSPC